MPVPTPRAAPERQPRRPAHDYEQLLAGIDAIIWESVADGSRLTFVSEHAEAALGHPIVEWYEPGFRTAQIHHGDRECATEAYRRAAQERRTQRTEFRMLAADGRSVWMQDIVSVIVTEDAVTGLRGVMTDVTARKEAEAAGQRALREDAARLAEAQQIAKLGYWENDLERDRITWSDETYRILGLRPQEVPPTLAEFRARIHPADRALQEEITALAQLGENRYDIEYRLVRPSGEVRTVYSVGTVVRDKEGRPRRAFGIVQDITDRRRTEQALEETHSLLHAIIDSTPDVIFVKDKRGRYLLMNAAGARSLGKTAEEIVGKTDRMLHPAELANTIMARDQQVLTTGTPHTFEETVTQEGVARTYVTTKGVYRDAMGRTAGLIGISSDVTELKMLEAQFRQAQKMEAVGQLAGGVAHDFNNVLTVISACGTMALEAVPTDAPARAELEQIMAAAQRASSLTRQLLTFSRRQVLQPRVLDVNRTVSTVATLLGRVIGADVALRTELDSAPWPVLADPGQLEQALMNLAVNGRDAMPRGGTLRLQTRRVDVGAALDADRPGLVAGQYMLLAVEDTGTGMEDNVRSHLFEPFFTTKGPGKGTGLGLAMVYGIVEQSGGSIYVDSTQGRGSCFSIYLPRHHALAGAEEETLPTPAPHGTERILLVEDDDALRPIVRRMLERQGYAVLDAADGEKAVQVAASADARGEKIDLVLTDVVVPLLAGRLLGDVLAARCPGLRVLYMSGYGDDEILRRGLVVPGAVFLEKPFTPEQLADTVRRALDRPAPSNGD